MPLDDWQFWVVTVVCLAGAWLIVRPFVPRRRKPRSRRVDLTVEGKDRGKVS